MLHFKTKFINSQTASLSSASLKIASFKTIKFLDCNFKNFSHTNYFWSIKIKLKIKVDL